MTFGDIWLAETNRWRLAQGLEPLPEHAAPQDEPEASGHRPQGNASQPAACAVTEQCGGPDNICLVAEARGEVYRCQRECAYK